jgi:alkylation response protein AidB-like acyl-CoA dehydrogenase
MVHRKTTMIRKLFERLTGINKVRDQARVEAEAAVKIAEEATVLAKQALDAVAVAQKAEAEAKLTPKDRATARGEPWVSVLDTHVNKDNVRNGFFELDWNAEFVLQLKQAGYGFDGDPDEEIVDRWFRDLAANMLAEAGQDPQRSSAGFINVSKLGGGKAVVE